MPYYIAPAQADGSQGTDVLQLSPGPTRVDYPVDALGSELQTPDGITIQQQPNYDGRLRSWVWSKYQSQMSSFQRLRPTLEACRARYRKELGFSPYVYLKETESGLFRKRVTTTVTGSVTSGGFTFTAQTGTPFTGLSLAGGFIYIGGAARGILSNTNNTVSVGDAFGSTQTNQVASLSYWVDTFFRCRVLSVGLDPRKDGGVVAYDEMKLSFVIDDVTWNYLG